VNWHGGELAGKVAMIWVDDDEEVVSATVPTVTVGPVLKPLPVMMSVLAAQLTTALSMTGGF
jgi:hypothetical protein